MEPAFIWAAGIVFLVLPTLLFWRILGKAGLPRWWALAGLIPILNVIALWLFAYCDWPARPPAPPISPA
ncbi:MAG: hypothetical protein V4723_07835 [Pseudomonadota bacterium]